MMVDGFLDGAREGWTDDAWLDASTFGLVYV